MAYVLIRLIQCYQRWLSPVMGQQCRFAPTCSQYALEAVTKHGALKGSYFATRRLLKCHPWHIGGHDPIP